MSVPSRGVLEDREELHDRTGLALADPPHAHSQGSGRPEAAAKGDTELAGECGRPAREMALMVTAATEPLLCSWSLGGAGCCCACWLGCCCGCSAGPPAVPGQGRITTTAAALAAAASNQPGSPPPGLLLPAAVSVASAAEPAAEVQAGWTAVRRQLPVPRRPPPKPNPTLLSRAPIDSGRPPPLAWFQPPQPQLAKKQARYREERETIHRCRGLRDTDGPWAASTDVGAAQAPRVRALWRQMGQQNESHRVAGWQASRQAAVP